MKKTLLYMMLCLVAVPCAFAGNDKAAKERKDWGYLTGSLESTNHFYVEDVANNFFPSMQPQLKEGNIFATNDYLKLDYYKDRLSAGMQLEGYFPALVGYPNVLKGMSLSNLYLAWRDKSYSVTLGSFYEQFGSGLLFRSWEDRMLGLNNAMWGARATYNWEDKISAKLLWGVPRLGTGVSEEGFFGLGLTDTWSGGADLSISLSELLGMSEVSLSLEGSFLTKYEGVSPEMAEKGYRPYNLGWSGRVNLEYDGLFMKGEYVDAGSQMINQFLDPVKGNAQLLEIGYNKKGLGVTLTGRRLERMTQKIYAFTSDAPGYFSTSNLMSYVPAMSTQYTYMLTTLNPYSPVIGDVSKQAGEIGGQVDVFYNFRRGTTIGGKRGMKVHANFATYYTLNENGGVKGGKAIFRDFSFDVEKHWTKKFKSVLLYSLQEYDKIQPNTGAFIGLSHIVVADLLYKWTSTISTRMELQYLTTKDDQGDWVAGLLEFNLAPHWSIYASDMWNHGGNGLHYYNGGASFTISHLRLAVGYGRYKAGFICSGGVCREIPAYTGANISLTASF